MKRRQQRQCHPVAPSHPAPWEKALPLFLLMEWAWQTACATSGRVHRWRVSASCRVNGPSRTRRMPTQTAELRSSKPTSCSSLRRYLWVSFMHWTSAGEKLQMSQNALPVRGGCCVCLLGDEGGSARVPRVKRGGWKSRQRRPVRMGGVFPSGNSIPLTASS